MIKNKNIPLVLAGVVCSVSLIVMFAVLMKTPQSKQLPFIPPSFEENAILGTPNVPDGLGWGEVDAQVYKASVCGVISIDGNTADIWFANPDSNSVWLKLRVLDSEGNILGETGIIKPGEYVQTITFVQIPEVGDTIGLKIMAYEPETYYSAGSAVLTTTVTGGGK